jgi:hypothetical protein
VEEERREEEEGENKKVLLFCPWLYCSENHHSMRTDMGLEGTQWNPQFKVFPH